MDKITFANNAQPAINDINLNLMQDNIENEIITQINMLKKMESKITGIVPESTSTSKNIEYPDGFTVDNCYIAAIKIYYTDDNRRIEPSWIDIYMNKTGVSIKGNEELALNKKIEIILRKNPE